MREQVTGLEVGATAEKRMDTPPGYDGIHVKYVVRGKGLSPEKVERAVELSEEKYCTVWNALSKATEITHTIEIIEE